MKSYDELKAKIESFPQQMVRKKNYERAKTLRKTQEPCRGLRFTAGILKQALAEDRAKQ